MISCNGEPYTLKGVSTVLRGDYANLLQKCDKAAFSYSTRRDFVDQNIAVLAKMQR